VASGFSRKINAGGSLFRLKAEATANFSDVTSGFEPTPTGL
jgi:hypothetical protein